METYDILRTEMRVIQPVFKEDQVKMLKDKRITMLLNFLQTPKTFKEIEKFLLNLENITNSINVNEYLTELIEAGLIIEVGRRISRDKKQRMCINKLYSRSACIFNIRMNNQPRSFCNKELRFLEEILYEGKTTKSNSKLPKIDEQMKQIVKWRSVIFDDLVLRSNELLSSDAKNYDWNQIYTLLDIASWLILFKNNKKNLDMLFSLYD